MRSHFSVPRLLGTTSMLALSAGAVIATAMIQPAAAATPAGGLWGGGSYLSSLTVRQIFDCYNGAEVAGDFYSTAASFSSTAPTPGLLPTSCAKAGFGGVEGLFAAVGSGRGLQAFIANDSRQLVFGHPIGFWGEPYPAIVGTPVPQPPFVDAASSNGNFNSYPYPGLTFAAADSPLPSVGAASLTTNAFTFGSFPTTGWATGTTPAPIAVAGTTTVGYDVANLGAPIQLPLYEVPVAIAVNTSNLDGLQSAAATPSAAGGAIQLSTAQVCAIFSGTVTDWSSAAPIATLDENGNVGYQLFSDDNVSTTAASTAKAYASRSTPIHVAYDKGNSGTSYIFTNYLQASCAALDNGSGATTTINGVAYSIAANHYATIFGAANLPSNHFADLKDNVLAAGNHVHHWKAEHGSLDVARMIGAGHDHHATPGAIGYLGVNFTAPYANARVLHDAPHSASVQNEYQREQGIYHPANGTSFVSPTPAGARNAFVAFNSNAVLSTDSTDYNNWNLYSYTYTTADSNYNPVPAVLQGKSVLGIPDSQNAYPVVGTTFLYAYSCYANANSTTGHPPIVDLLSWYYNDGNSDANATVDAVLENNGFSRLNSDPAQTGLNVANVIYNQFLRKGSNGISLTGTAATNAACTNAHGA
jgi:hypothetical protein